jgi:AAA15 family ATPase/GTPase
MPESLQKVALERLKLENRSVLTRHAKYDENGEISSEYEWFELDKEESEGTRKLFALSGAVSDALEKGRPVIIDEFDARLHPLITQAIIALFNSNATNPNNAQLIFMTHDTNLLNLRHLRRDQIWFVEKDRRGSSHLYSLAEFQIRNDDASIESDYIQGKFGAIPFLGGLKRLLEPADANAE